MGLAQDAQCIVATLLWQQLFNKGLEVQNNIDMLINI